MFNNTAVKQEVHKLLSTRPGWTFQNAWDYLQAHRPDLFDSVPNHAGISLDNAPGILSHNQNIRTLADQLMKYAKGGDPTFAKKGAELVEALEEDYGSLDENKLIQCISYGEEYNHLGEDTPVKVIESVIDNPLRYEQTH